MYFDPQSQGLSWIYDSCRNDRNILVLKTERLLNVRLMNTQSWDAAEKEAVDADRGDEQEAGEHALV